MCTVHPDAKLMSVQEILMSDTSKMHEQIKKQFRTKILPPIHPETIRVRQIAKEVIEAAMAGAKAQNWGQLEHTHVPPSISDSGGSSSSSSWGEDLTTAKKDNLDNFPAHKQMYGTETLDDDHWVEKSRKKGLEEGSEGYTAHLESLKWEVLVVDQDIMNAFCLPGGKIVVFTGLLKHFRSDSEIATVLAHEVKLLGWSILPSSFLSGCFLSCS